MCTSKAEGGKRCELADALANVRRKTRYAQREAGDSTRERAVRKAVEKFCDENKELVRQHLPERQPFQVAPGKSPIPQHILDMFARERGESIKGNDNVSALTNTAYENHKEWMARLNDDEEWSVRWYSMHGYEGLNRLLRRRGFSEWMKENMFLTDGGDVDGYINEHLMKRKKSLDAALKKGIDAEHPQRVFRFFSVPAGVSPTEYLTKYFKAGESFQDKGYMSTTLDPEFAMAHIYKANNGKRNQRFIVMEIVTHRGCSLQQDERTEPGDIQSFEHEVLLPRNAKLRVVATKRSQKFEFASDRDDLARQYHRYYDNAFRKGDTMSLPVVQLVDERLIKNSVE